MSTPGIYQVVYSIVNADGITAKSVRSVYVIDPAGGIPNVYYARSRNASGSLDFRGCPTVISATSAPNVYFWYLSCFQQFPLLLNQKMTM